MKTKMFVGFVWLVVSHSLFAWPPDYYPSWQVSNTWQVEVTYLMWFPDRDAIGALTNVPQYPYTGLYEIKSTNVIYTYTVVSNNAFYQYKYPLYDPFVSRPGHPNLDSNTTVVAVLDVQPPTNSFIFNAWRLFYATNSMALLEVWKRGRGSRSEVNAYGHDAWLDWWDGRKIINDFPMLPDTEKDEIRNIKKLHERVNDMTQVVTFSNDVAVVILSRFDVNYGMEQTATFNWEKGKKWWTSESGTGNERCCFSNSG